MCFPQDFINLLPQKRHWLSEFLILWFACLLSVLPLCILELLFVFMSLSVKGIIFFVFFSDLLSSIFLRFNQVNRQSLSGLQRICFSFNFYFCSFSISPTESEKFFNIHLAFWLSVFGSASGYLVCYIVWNGSFLLIKLLSQFLSCSTVSKFCVYLKPFLMIWPTSLMYKWNIQASTKINSKILLV